MTDSTKLISKQNKTISALTGKIAALQEEINKPKPEKLGNWIERLYPYNDYIGCSCCNAEFNICDNCTELFKYCPNCGAKMEDNA